jgi:hypothetical protein
MFDVYDTAAYQKAVEGEPEEVSIPKGLKLLNFYESLDTLPFDIQDNKVKKAV